MTFLKTSVWNWWDVVVLKWCCLFFGMLVGAFFHEFVMEYFWIILLAAFILAIKSSFVYWKD